MEFHKICRNNTYKKCVNFPKILVNSVNDRSSDGQTDRRTECNPLSNTKFLSMWNEIHTKMHKAILVTILTVLIRSLQSTFQVLICLVT